MCVAGALSSASASRTYVVELAALLLALLERLLLSAAAEGEHSERKGTERKGERAAVSEKRKRAVACTHSLSLFLRHCGAARPPARPPGVHLPFASGRHCVRCGVGRACVASGREQVKARRR